MYSFVKKTAEKIIHCNQRNSMFLEVTALLGEDVILCPVLIINFKKEKQKNSGKTRATEKVVYIAFTSAS